MNCRTVLNKHADTVCGACFCIFWDLDKKGLHVHLGTLFTPLRFTLFTAQTHTETQTHTLPRGTTAQIPETKGPCHQKFSFHTQDMKLHLWGVCSKQRETFTVQRHLATGEGCSRRWQTAVGSPSHINMACYINHIKPPASPSNEMHLSSHVVPSRQKED